MLSVSPLGAILACIAFTVIYVGSLYIWKFENFKYLDQRDHPQTIQRRFISVIATSLLCTAYVYWVWRQNPAEGFWYLLGIHTESILFAVLLPLLLTVVLFIGPIVLILVDEEPADPLLDIYDLKWWRNQIIGPLTEEWVFRSCMSPLLISAGFGKAGTIFISPFLFGCAHLHHIRLHLHKQGRALTEAWKEILLQLGYTSVFGCYSAFIFLRTGHSISPFLVHAFCNYMGFPRFGVLADHPKQKVLLGSFVAGLVLFMVLLFPLTDPSIYNSIYWITS